MQCSQAYRERSDFLLLQSELRGIVHELLLGLGQLDCIPVQRLLGLGRVCQLRVGAASVSAVGVVRTGRPILCLTPENGEIINSQHTQHAISLRNDHACIPCWGHRSKPVRGSQHMSGCACTLRARVRTAVCGPKLSQVRGTRDPSNGYAETAFANRSQPRGRIP